MDCLPAEHQHSAGFPPLLGRWRLRSAAVALGTTVCVAVASDAPLPSMAGTLHRTEGLAARTVAVRPHITWPVPAFVGENSPILRACLVAQGHQERNPDITAANVDAHEHWMNPVRRKVGCRAQIHLHCSSDSCGRG